ncbi:hypothetical protein [Desulfosporosinus sp. BICA1-9]|uniref:hypothetical protein n=1 Tax=Desulfosporosinus sp. BICA1-9 TaxID=1531958 RepID=UPI000A77DB0D|nr:hypothetical protein [Desulfosporosinus sp. BICA1-9]HBW38503.1 hypothetical protein [Desulfosporosinus sp.]
MKNELTLRDPRFYTLTIKNIGLANWVGVIRSLYSGKGFANNNTRSLEYTQQIKVYGSSRNNELEFDGDPKGFLPCVIEPAQDPLDVISQADQI